ncbi:MAG: DUF3786 domain-containing protein, partial [Oscillospiraceae bacterium]|nr:DUF3786 domain-containing protein [Oscillospiraceae bacterium]
MARENKQMSGQRVSNYEKLCEQWRLRFLEMDRSALKRKLPELKEEGEYLAIRHFGRRLGIHRSEGVITALDDYLPVSLTTKFNVYTLLYYCKDGGRFLNDWRPFPQLKDASNYGPAYERTVIRDFGATFSGQTELLEEAFRKMGGTKLPLSDVGYEVKAFECIPVRFFFWDGDDEFPA